MPREQPLNVKLSDLSNEAKTREAHRCIWDASKSLRGNKPKDRPIWLKDELNCQWGAWFVCVWEERERDIENGRDSKRQTLSMMFLNR